MISKIEEIKMSRPRKIRILLASVFALVVGITLYFQYQSHQEQFQLKTSFEEKDGILSVKNEILNIAEFAGLPIIEISVDRKSVV